MNATLHHSRNLLHRYGLALLAPVALMLLRDVLVNAGLIGGALTLPFFVIAAAIAGGLGGFWAGMAATAFGGFLLSQYVYPGDGHEAMALRLLNLFLLGLTVSVVAGAQQRASRRAQALADNAARRAADLQDINDRLSRQERSLLQAQRVAHFGTWEVDVKLGINRFSDELCVLIGIEPGTPLDFAAASALTYPEDIARVDASFRNCLAQREAVWRVEHRRLHPQRGLIWLEVRAEVAYDEQGRVTRMIGATMDVTERRRAEDALRASERMLSLIYENSRDALYLAQVESAERYVLVSANQAFLKVSGYRRDQVIGRPMEEVMPSLSNHAKVRAQYQRAIEARRAIVYEEIADLPAGQKYGEIHLIPIFKEDGPVTHILGAIKDITDQRRAQKKLRESEEQFRRAMEEAPIPVIMCADDGEVLQVSKTWVQLTGFALADVPTFESWLGKSYG
ncbi:MAG TPA: PAS domain S-box protein, partial [Nevskiaceae bacterium]|nr:PAS domain S-box protein [Nevskiaceae bacterium]